MERLEESINVQSIVRGMSHRAVRGMMDGAWWTHGLASQATRIQHSVFVERNISVRRSRVKMDGENAWTNGECLRQRVG
jgi:hypothetical protein